MVADGKQNKTKQNMELSLIVAKSSFLQFHILYIFKDRSLFLYFI